MDRPQFEVADVFRCYGTDYRQEHGASMSNAQHGVMTAIEVCRTAFLGGHLEQCDQCGHQRNAYNCCNRHCPKCHLQFGHLETVKSGESYSPEGALQFGHLQRFITAL